MSRWLRVAMALGGLALTGTGRAYAQGAESVRADIPFDFKVGHATLPAGEYSLRYDPAEAPSVLTVRSADSRHEAFVLTERVDAKRGTPNANKLVFEREGTTYVLSEVFTGDSSVGLEILGTQPAD
jgi:hypothetical protein